MNYCEVCNVKYAADSESVELHESGKRHIKLEASYRELKDIAKKSVFLKWSAKAKISTDELQKEMTKFGPISRFLHKEDTNFAILEFQGSNSATDALQVDQLQLPQGTVTILKRELDFNSEVVEEKKINPRDIMMDAVKVPITSENTYDNQIDYIINHIAISAEQMKSREANMARLETEINKYFYGAKIRMFGSSITTIGTIDSDVDASLEFDPQAEFTDFGRDKFVLLTANAALFSANKISRNEMSKLSLADQTRLLCKILNEVRKTVPWLGHQRPVLDARCPVVRFTMNKKLIVDLSCNNLLGRAKSEYLRCLIDTDRSGNLRKILLAFRFWALTNDLFEPLPKQHKGQFNAYMLNLLVIYFLIERKVVPVFTHSAVEVKSRSYRIDFEVPQFSLGRLNIPTFFRQFFLYMIDMKDESHLRAGSSLQPLEVQYVLGQVPESFKLGILNVQDPIELGHNVCQNVCQKMLSRMRRRMTYSLSKMKAAKHTFCDLLFLEEVKPISKEAKNIHSVRVFVIPDGKVDQTDHNQLKSVVLGLAEGILGFDSKVQPSTKKRRVSDEFEDYERYQINTECWIGRRSIKKKVAESVLKNKGEPLKGYDLELEITRSMLLATNMPDSPLGEAMVGMEIKGNEVFLKLVPLNGPDILYNNITHFLETFVSNYCQDVTRSLVYQEQMEE